MTIALDDVAKAAAHKYRSTARADFDDLLQQAWLAITQARNTFDPNYGIPFEAYAWRACMRALAKYVERTCSPVGGGQTAVAKITTMQIVEWDRIDIGDLEGCLDAARWQHATRARLDALLAEVPDGALAALVLLDEYRPSEVAKRRRVPVKRVYRATTRARQHLAADVELRRLFDRRCRPVHTDATEVR